MRLRARVDANHNEIVNGLRAAGRSVTSIAAIGKGVPDLLVGRNGVNYLLEVKTDKGDLTEDQVKFISNWRGEVHIVRTIDEAIRATA